MVEDVLRVRRMVRGVLRAGVGVVLRVIVGVFLIKLELFWFLLARPEWHHNKVHCFPPLLLFLHPINVKK